MNWHVSLVFFLISPKFLERKLNLTIPPKGPRTLPTWEPETKKVRFTWQREKINLDFCYLNWINELMIHHPSHPSNLDANLFSEVWWKKMWRSGPFLRATDVVGATNPFCFCFFWKPKKDGVEVLWLFSPAFFFVPLFLFETQSVFTWSTPGPSFARHIPHPPSWYHIDISRFIRPLKKNAAKTHIDVRHHETMQ